MTESITEITTGFLLILLGIPVLMFVVECLLGLLSPSKSSFSETANSEKLRSVILIPAHDESEVIGATLANIVEKITGEDQILVVADNCEDSTAELAKKSGAMVVERRNLQEKGKGYALSYGINAIKDLFEIPPDIVIIIDADCYVEKDTLQLLKAYAFKTQLPVQCCYLMKSGTVDRLSVKIAEFTFLVKNRIRMRGLEFLGVPVPLTGSGMAFPWDILCSTEVGTGDIVEDMLLGVELVENKLGPKYIDVAQVVSFFPTDRKAEKTQRQRWEHGHLNILIAFLPRLFFASLKQKNLSVFGSFLNLTIPPLSLLVILIALFLFLFSTIALLITGDWSPTLILSIYLCSIVVVTALIWWTHGKQILSLPELLGIPFFVLKKGLVYIGYVFQKQTSWIRTNRK